MKELLKKNVFDSDKVYLNLFERKINMNKMKFAIAGLVIILAGIVFYQLAPRESVKTRMITVDINPSVGFVIDEDDKVVEVLTLNEDSVVMIEEEKYLDKPIDDAIDALVDDAVDMGYINELEEDNVVNVTTYLEDEEDNDELNDRVRERIEARMEYRETYGLVIKNGLDDELKAKADELDVAYGKMLLISRAETLEVEATEQELADMTIKEIQALIKEKAVAKREEIRNLYEQNEDKIEEARDKIITEAKEKADEAKNKILEKSEKYNSLTDSEKKALIENEKEEIRQNVEQIKEKVQTKTEETINSIREAIKNRRAN